jgi:hypothetical protein
VLQGANSYSGSTNNNNNNQYGQPMSSSSAAPQPAYQSSALVVTAQPENLIQGIVFDCTSKPTGPNRDTKYCDIFHACVFGKQAKTYACSQAGGASYYDEYLQRCEFVAVNPNGCPSKTFYQAAPPSNANSNYQQPQQPSYPQQQQQQQQPSYQANPNYGQYNPVPATNPPAGSSYSSYATVTITPVPVTNPQTYVPMTNAVTWAPLTNSPFNPYNQQATNPPATFPPQTNPPVTWAPYSNAPYFQYSPTNTQAPSSNPPPVTNAPYNPYMNQPQQPNYQQPQQPSYQPMPATQAPASNYPSNNNNNQAQTSAEAWRTFVRSNEQFSCAG